MISILVSVFVTANVAKNVDHVAPMIIKFRYLIFQLHSFLHAKKTSDNNLPSGDPISYTISLIIISALLIVRHEKQSVITMYI